MLPLLILFLAAKVQGDTCRVLALEGGGDKGAYEAGALIGLTTYQSKEDYAYDFITGVSAGALNSGVLSQYHKGDEAAGARAAANMWLTAPVSKLLKQWPGGYVQGAFFESSMLDGSDLYPWYKSVVPDPPVRNISVGATNGDLGEFQDFDAVTMGYPLMIEGILSSAAFPVFVPPRQLYNYTMLDGGCMRSVDITFGIERCLNQTNHVEQDVIIDTIILSGKPLSVDDATKLKVWGVFDRVKAIRNEDEYLWYISAAKEAYPNVNFRYTILPSETLPGGLIPLDFKHSDLEKMVSLGEADVKKIIDGSKGNTQEVLKKLKEKKNKAFPFYRA